MSSSYVPAGPEVATTLQPSQSVASPTVTPQSSSSNPGISPASIASIVVFLSLFILLAVLGVTICLIRKRRTTSKVSYDWSLEKEAVRDVEALAATHPVIPVTPPPSVRWTPQIRSISGPAPDKHSDRKSAVLHSKRARSPPPSNPIRPRSLFPDPHPNSAPARTSSFSRNETPYPGKNWRGEPDSPVTPQALAVSGMQTRSLARSGPGSKN